MRSGEPERPVVLLVDDDLSTRELIRSILGTGYEVLEGENMREGMHHVEGGRVELVLLDVMMPEEGGLEGCKRIKAQAKARGDYLPVLLLTALNRQTDRNEGLEAGADDFLTKPINRGELLLRVQAFLRLSQQERPLKQQIIALRAADALKEDLVALLVHDLRNPLSGITCVLESMADSTIDERWREDVNLAVTAGDELKEILEDILHVKRFESGTLELRRETVDVNLVVAASVASVAGSARARAVRIVGMPGLSPLIVSADRKLLRRALENLLSNAIKYSPSGDEVRITANGRDGVIEFEVSDSGIGVPEVFKTELFKKFGSVEAASGGVRRGFGLGLYMVDLVAKAHGGKATVRDRAGGGTVFGIVVPTSAGPAGLRV